MESRKALRARFVPPDGGYGWLVAFAAFLVQFWITGLLKSFGVIYMEIMLLHPTASASIASWIPAILSTLGLVLCEEHQIGYTDLFILFSKITL